MSMPCDFALRTFSAISAWAEIAAKHVPYPALFRRAEEGTLDELVGDVFQRVMDADFRGCLFTASDFFGAIRTRVRMG